MANNYVDAGTGALVSWSYQQPTDGGSMLSSLQPVKIESLKQACATRLEKLIISGQLPVGKKLPPERELAQQLGVSRPVAHEALVNLAARGLVTMVPRVGTIINDYRKEGSIALLTSLLKYQEGELAPQLLDGLLAMRRVFEVETARLAATFRTAVQVGEMRTVIQAEAQTAPSDIERLTALDFEFHHLIALASGNPTYPLLINSFKPVYTNLSSRFFGNPAVVPEMIGFHRRLLDAIDRQDDRQAAEVMEQLLSHGEEHLRETMST